MTLEHSENIIEYLRRHHALKVVTYHLFATPLMIFILSSPHFRTGPCTPNLDILVYPLDVLITLIWFVASTAALFARGRVYLLPFIINLMALIILVVLNFRQF